MTTNREIARERTCVESLRASVVFWKEQCGFDHYRVQENIQNFWAVAYSPAERKEAIPIVLQEHNATMG